MKEKKQIVMLPTNEAVKPASIMLYKGKDKHIVEQLNMLSSLGNVEVWNKVFGDLYQQQHLYILSDEKIEVADYRYSPEDGIYQVAFGYPDDAKKIIATTDPALHWKVAKISTEFITQYFIPAYNAGKPLTEVLVEYEMVHYTLSISFSGGEQGAWKKQLKLSSDGSAFVSIAEPRVFTEEDMNEAYDAGWFQCHKENTRQFKKWVAEKYPD